MYLAREYLDFLEQHLNLGKMKWTYYTDLETSVDFYTGKNTPKDFLQREIVKGIHMLDQVNPGRHIPILREDNEVANDIIVVTRYRLKHPLGEEYFVPPDDDHFIPCSKMIKRHSHLALSTGISTT